MVAILYHNSFNPTEFGILAPVTSPHTNIHSLFVDCLMVAIHPYLQQAQALALENPQRRPTNTCAQVSGTSTPSALPFPAIITISISGDWVLLVLPPTPCFLYLSRVVERQTGYIPVLFAQTRLFSCVETC